MTRSLCPATTEGVRLEYQGLADIVVDHRCLKLMGHDTFHPERDHRLENARRLLARGIMRDVNHVPPAAMMESGEDRTPKPFKAKIYARLLAEESEGDPWTLIRALVALTIEDAAKEDGEGPATSLVAEIRGMTGRALMGQVLP